MNKWIPQWIDYSNIPTNERSNISYDRELQCLSRTHGYEYPLQWSNFSDPIIIWEWNYSSNYQDINPDYSVVITLFDSLNGRVAEKTVESILKLTRGIYELIIVLDDVDDICVNTILHLVRNKWIYNNKTNYAINSLECSLNDFRNPATNIYVDQHMDKYLSQNTLIYDYCINHKKTHEWKTHCAILQRVILIRSWGIWEASSNNLGMCVASHNTKYYIHVQDDMQMTQIGWNINIILPLSLFPDDLFSVSARCATPIQNPFRSKLSTVTTRYWRKLDDNIAQLHGHISETGNIPSPIGRCGTDIDRPMMFNKFNKSIVYERSNSIRGPWAAIGSDMRKLGFWNEKLFKLQFDIPELSIRSMTYLHKHSSVFPLQFRSDLSWGGTRRKRKKKTDLEQKRWRQYELFRNDRRDYYKAFINTGKNKSIANYDGERFITFEMIDKMDLVHDFCVVGSKDD